MVNLARRDKQMAEALFQLLKVQQNRGKKEETYYIKPEMLSWNNLMCQKIYLFTQSLDLNTSALPTSKKEFGIVLF